MTEDPRNVGFVCEAHSPRPDPRWLEYPPAWFVGRLVKVAFPISPCPEDAPDWLKPKWPAPGGHEHGWVRVIQVAENPGELDGHELICVIDSDLLFALDVGDHVAIHRMEVEEVAGQGPGPRGPEQRN